MKKKRKQNAHETTMRSGLKTIPSAEKETQQMHKEKNHLANFNRTICTRKKRLLHSPITAMTRQGKQIVVEAFNWFLLQHKVHTSPFVQLTHGDFFIS
jgi:hypothetical protein